MQQLQDSNVSRYHFFCHQLICFQSQNAYTNHLKQKLTNQLTEKSTWAFKNGQVKSCCRLPVIASSGAGCPEHFEDALKAGGDAALAAGIFHREEVELGGGLEDEEDEEDEDDGQSSHVFNVI